MASSPHLDVSLPGQAAGSALASALGDFMQPPPSPQMAVFKQKQREIAELSTVGLITMGGVSPKNLALEALVCTISDLPTAAEQVKAMAAILSESATLWADQNIFVIARCIQHLLTPGRITLKDGAQPPIGAQLITAALQIAPDLMPRGSVNDTMAYDLLRCGAIALLRRPEFALPAEMQQALEAIGIRPDTADATADPQNEEIAWSRERTAWLRSEIAARVDKQISREDLTRWVEAARPLPDELRSRFLTLLVNVFWNTLRDQTNNPLNDKVFEMIDALPSRHRITPLEACYNQLNFLAWEMAQTLLPILIESVLDLQESEDERYNRSRRDLIAAVRKQGEAFRTADFKKGESLALYRDRIKRRNGAA